MEGPMVATDLVRTSQNGLIVAVRKAERSMKGWRRREANNNATCVLVSFIDACFMYNMCMNRYRDTEGGSPPK